MDISDIKIRKILSDDNRLKAIVSITIDGLIAIHDIKVVQGNERLFVAMPSRKDESGNFRDIIHPITASAREQIENSILSAYNNYMDNLPAQ